MLNEFQLFAAANQVCKRKWEIYLVVLKVCVWGRMILASGRHLGNWGEGRSRARDTYQPSKEEMAPNNRVTPKKL